MYNVCIYTYICVHICVYTYVFYELMDSNSFDVLQFIATIILTDTQVHGSLFILAPESF